MHSNLLTSLLCVSTVSIVLLPTTVLAARRSPLATRSSCSCSFALYCTPYSFCLTFVKENSYAKLKINDIKASHNCRTVQQHNTVTTHVTTLHYNTFQCHGYTKVHENIVQNIPHYQITTLPEARIMHWYYATIRIYKDNRKQPFVAQWSLYVPPV